MNSIDLFTFILDIQPAHVTLCSHLCIESKAMVAFIEWCISLFRGSTFNLKLIKEFNELYLNGLLKESTGKQLALTKQSQSNIRIKFISFVHFQQHTPDFPHFILMARYIVGPN